MSEIDWNSLIHKYEYYYTTMEDLQNLFAKLFRKQQEAIKNGNNEAVKEIGYCMSYILHLKPSADEHLIIADINPI